MLHYSYHRPHWQLLSKISFRLSATNERAAMFKQALQRTAVSGYQSWITCAHNLRSTARLSCVVPSHFQSQFCNDFSACPEKNQVAVISHMSANCAPVCRLTGRAAFRHAMLGRYGTVVTISYNPDSSIKSMADDLQAATEAKTGLPLKSFHR